MLYSNSEYLRLNLLIAQGSQFLKNYSLNGNMTFETISNFKSGKSISD